MPLGAFTFVLHTHLPYVRMAGRWPHGEEMLHEAIAETYIPLLQALYDLREEGVDYRLAIGITPILMEQLADEEVKKHFVTYLEERIQLAEEDAKFHSNLGEKAIVTLAYFYKNWYTGILESFTGRFGRDILGAFRRLQDEGCIEVLTSAASHAYLPLLDRDSSVYAQLRIGVQTYLRHMGKMPKGIWLPECGYRPGFMRDPRPGEPVKHSYYKPGIEEFLADLNLQFFFTDSYVIEGGRMVGKVAGDVVGPYGGVPKRRLVIKTDELPIVRKGTTFRPYYIQAARVAVFGRDEGTGLQVWSASYGYPGDYLYREFHRKDEHSGLKYWRVTGAQVDLGQKELYDYERARGQVKIHVDHFCNLVKERLRNFNQSTSLYGIIVSAYDTELFGHWWFEGVLWLKEVLRSLSRDPEIELTTPSSYLERYPPTEAMAIPESSWGLGGAHWTWLNPETEWMWPLIHNAERTMEELVRLYPDGPEPMLGFLNQAARELLLLQASDWPFLVSTGQARDYAIARFQQHLARFNHLVSIARRGEISPQDQEFLAEISRLDNPFPDIDYRLFAWREQA